MLNRCFVATIGKFLGGEQKVFPVTAQPPSTYDPAQKAFLLPVAFSNSSSSPELEQL